MKMGGATLARTGGTGKVQRGLVLLTGVAITWFAFASAVSGITRAKNPALALRLSPHDPVALAVRADAQLGSTPTSAAMARISGLARQSLTEQAINARALRLLGYATEARNELPKAHRMIKLAARVSRREVSAQLWLIEYSVRANDVKAALEHYDVALRSAPELGQTFFPILTAAIEDPAIQKEFVWHVKAAAPWMPYFLSYAINQDNSTPVVAAVVTRAGGLPDQEIYRGLESQIVGRLAVTGKFPDARRFYLSLKEGRPKVLTSTAFDKDSTNVRFVPLTWQLLDTASISASFAETDEGAARTLHVSATSRERGLAAQKILFLREGQYRFNAKQNFAQSSGEASSYWEMKCLRGAEALSVWRSDGRQGDPRGPSILSNCPVQLLELNVDGGDSPDGAELTVESVSLSRGGEAGRAAPVSQN